jgi:hypothetical protein
MSPSHENKSHYASAFSEYTMNIAISKNALRLERLERQFVYDLPLTLHGIMSACS